jgi:hypothetical protein
MRTAYGRKDRASRRPSVTPAVLKTDIKARAKPADLRKLLGNQCNSAAAFTLFEL